MAAKQITNQRSGPEALTHYLLKQNLFQNQGRTKICPLVLIALLRGQSLNHFLAAS